ncbi:MAG: glycosyltransferase, partial [Gemmatimonadota bacterium]
MRVLLLNYEYPPLGGGAGVATAALAARLSDEGHDVDVVTSRAPHDSIEEPPALAGPAWEPRGGRAAAETSTGTLAVHRVASLRHGLHDAGLSGAAGYLLTALPVVRRLARERSYTVAHVFFSLPTGAILPFAGLRGVPLVVSLRGSDVPGYDPRAARLRVLHRALLPVTRWIWGRADRVVAVCDSLARLARRTKPDLCCDVIPNGVDLDLFRPDLARGEAGPGGPLRCIAVARLVERKGLATLLRAFAQLPPERFRLEIV